MIRWDEDELQAYLARFNRPSVAITKHESRAINVTTPTHEIKTVHPRYRIRIHQCRQRLIDPDNTYGKAAIDGMVAAGVLPDDSPEWIQSIEFSQEKVRCKEQEQTVIELYELCPGNQ